MSELITVIDEALSVIDTDSSSTDQVGWLVEFFFLQRHSWAMSQNWSFGKLLLFQKFWEWIHSAILSVNLFDLNGTIGKVVVEDVVFVSTIEAFILPKNVESQHLSVVVQETFKGFVGSTTFQLDLDIVL